MAEVFSGYGEIRPPDPRFGCGEGAYRRRYLNHRSAQGLALKYVGQKSHRALCQG